MGIAEGIKDIVQDILSSRGERASEIEGLKKEADGLKKEADEMIGSFKASRDEFGAQLRQDLAHDKAKMAAEIRTMQSGFQSSHKKMGSTLKKNLTQGTTARKSGTHAMFNDFQKSRNQMSTQLRQMSTQLRKDLDNFDHGIKSEVAGMRSEVAGMRQEAKADLGEARIAWQGLNRGTRKANAAVRAKVKVVKANGKKKAAPVKDEPYDMETRLLAIINNQPSGITITEASENLNIAPIVFRHLSRKLLDEGKIRREKDTYFPAS